MTSYAVLGGRVQTRSLEYHVADHCNLRCEHCCSFSPLLKKQFADPAEFERDLRAVSRVVQSQFLKIVGGEPLLHPELESLLVIARQIGTTQRIQLTTNGFLIKRLTPRAWSCLNILTVSLYPEPALPKEVIRHIAREAAARGVEVSWKVQDRFNCMDRTEVASYEETYKVFQECWLRHRCHSLKGGRFYSCTRPQYVQKLAGDAASPVFLQDGVLVDEPDAERLAQTIKAYLERTEPLQSCFLCQGGDAPLETNRQLTPVAVRSRREQLVTLTGQIAAVAG